MILRLYLFSLYMTLFLSFGLSAILIFNVNPNNAPFWIIIIFYLAIFLFFMTFLGLVGFYFKIKASNREIIFGHILPTLRQAALISFLIISLLFLLQLKVLAN